MFLIKSNKGNKYEKNRKLLFRLKVIVILQLNKVFCGTMYWSGGKTTGEKGIHLQEEKDEPKTVEVDPTGKRPSGRSGMNQRLRGVI